jgi:riboflavin kinase/FMN adenylyltransferase
VPAHGIYAGAARGHRVALLDFAGDLYGQELRVELWDRLREERAFTSEEELVEQIGRDVEAARAATRPA